MAERLLAEGEKGQHQCDRCLKLFDFVGNGKWIPTTCPDCSKKHPPLKNIFDELQRIERQIKESRPDNWIDIILSTKYPIGENGLRVEYKGKTYLVFHWATLQKVKSECITQKAGSPIATGFFALTLGIPVIENDELVKEILLDCEKRANKHLQRTGEAGQTEFIFNS